MLLALRPALPALVKTYESAGPDLEIFVFFRRCFSFSSGLHPV